VSFDVRGELLRNLFAPGSFFTGDGGTISAKDLPKCVTRTGSRVLRTCSRIAEHLNIKSESRMKGITFARWKIECDAGTTRDLFDRVQLGAPETCGCLRCRNFAAARASAYPHDVIQLFDSLGIARNREAEVYHTHRRGPGRHHYGGWLHFVGRIVGGVDACKQIRTSKDGSVWGFDLEKVGDEFEIGFTHRIGLLEEPFKGHGVVQLEFRATAPWLLTEEEPDS
jgi:hypothetical protein